jgi:GDSL-like Lipase/Acylhydrolase family
MRIHGNTAALAVLAIGALLAGWAYLKRDAAISSHRRVRQVVLHYTLSRFDQPIIILGDSITEASTLPRSFCDHPLVNAGLDGASTASDLGPWLMDVLNGRRAAAVLVALGTNDALNGRSAGDFESDYSSLLSELAKATDRLAVLGIPGIEVRGHMTSDVRDAAMGRIDAFNALLPALAGKSGAVFAALPPMPAPFTIDGVHLNAAGYGVWDAAVLKGVSGLCS